VLNGSHDYVHVRLTFGIKAGYQRIEINRTKSLNGWFKMWVKVWFSERLFFGVKMGVTTDKMDGEMGGER